MRRKPKAKSINLALQGGGAIGAFTWGVLDTLLADGRLTIDAVSGTSAGAMNAIMLVDGLARGGNDGARDQLQRFWTRISNDSAAIAAADQAWDTFSRMWGIKGFSPYEILKMTASAMSPYNFNPLNYNPLLTLVEELVDFDNIKDHRAATLYLSATNVETGQIRVFTNHEMDAKVVMASACLPFLFQAVEIDGAPYWDGGYSGNPAMWPFIWDDTAEDVLLIQLDPMVRKDVPRTPRDVMDRMRELTFNNSLIHETRALDFVNQLVDAHAPGASTHPKKRLHRIDAALELLEDQRNRTIDISWRFMGELHDAGCQAATRWLAEHYDHIGIGDTVQPAQKTA